MEKRGREKGRTYAPDQELDDLVGEGERWKAVAMAWDQEVVRWVVVLLQGGV